MEDDPIVSLRPITDADDEFLCAVYASTRAADLALLDWDDVQKEDFVRRQFDAQQRHYVEHYPDATFQVVVVGGQPVGRLYLASAADETRIVDIALLPDFRRQGVGTTLLRGVLFDAQFRGACVTAHVERHNQALRLYSRLDFALVQDRGAYLFLRWAPPEPPASHATSEGGP